MYLLSEELDKLKDNIENVYVGDNVATALVRNSDTKVEVLFAPYGKIAYSCYVTDTKGRKLFEIVNADDVLSVVFSVFNQDGGDLGENHQNDFLKAIGAE